MVMGTVISQKIGTNNDGSVNYQVKATDAKVYPELLSEPTLRR